VGSLGWKTAALLGLRHFPPALAALMALSPRRISGGSGADGWEHQYKSGEWDRLRDLREAARYHVLAGYAARLCPGASVLDVGCGEGILAPYLLGAGARAYFGVDCSREAILRATAVAPLGAQFWACDVGALSLDEQFEVIVLNEVLYYLDDPAAMIGRLARMLAPDGIILVSMALFGFRDGLVTLRTWRRIERAATVIDEITLSAPGGPAWIVKALAPVPPAGGS
jgi:2-polyprenyl-6-hydroxyphenyl methylase/3-demethylubiquinone-9 3-methyltransferase